MRWRLLVLTVLWMLMLGRESAALVDIIIDDSQADFSSFDGTVSTGTGNNSYGAGYHFIEGWGAFDGCDGFCPDARSARVFYRLPNDVLPAGDHLYNLYAWMPNHAWDQWHVLDAAGDGTENFDQDIDWAGQFGTSRQWMSMNPEKSFDSTLGGRWLKLGPDPQLDFAANGAVHLNPLNGTPYFFIGYQPWYNGTIVFDAIRIIQIEDGPLRGDYNLNGIVDAADYVLWRDTLGVSHQISTTTAPYKQFPLPAADGNSNAEVEHGDYNIWRYYFGNTDAAPGHAASGVPEPATLLLLALTGTACGATRRSRCALPTGR